MPKRTLQLVGLLAWCLVSTTFGAREAGSCSLAEYRQPTGDITEIDLDAPVASTPELLESGGGGCGAPACGGGKWAEFDVEALGLQRLAVRSADGEIWAYGPAAREPDGTFRFAIYEWELPSSRRIQIATLTADNERGAWASLTLPAELFD